MGAADRRAPERASRPPPWGRNLAIWAALMGLLALSLGLAYVPLGRVTTAIGVGVAFLKAALVAALYMELDRSNTLIRLAIAAGCLFAAVMFALTFTDVAARP